MKPFSALSRLGGWFVILFLFSLAGCKPWDYLTASFSDVKLDSLPATPQMKQLADAIREDPNNAFAYQQIAYALVQLKREGEIDPFIAKGLSLDQTNPMHSKIGWIYFNAGRYRDALAHWQQAAEISGGKAYYDQYCLALGYWRTGDVLKAVEQYDLAAQKNEQFREIETLTQYTLHWTPPEKQAIAEVYFAWRKGYRIRPD